MKKNILTFLLLTTLTSHVNAMPVMPNIFNLGLLSAASGCYPTFANVNTNTPAFTALCKHATTFIKKNHVYISCIALTVYLFWQLNKFKQQTSIAKGTKHPNYNAPALAPHSDIQNTLNTPIASEITWQYIYTNKQQQLDCLRTFFDSSEPWPTGIRHSMYAIQFINESDYPSVNKQPHVISYFDRPIFTTHATMRGRARTLCLDISCVANPDVPTIRVRIIPNDHLDKNELTNEFNNHAKAIFENHVKNAYLENKDISILIDQGVSQLIWTSRS
jgi:hypothetical protein